MAPIKGLSLAMLRAQVRDRKLREKLTPKFTIGCKRMLISNTYYPAIARDNVELVTDPIQRVNAHSITTADGTERPIDAHRLYGFPRHRLADVRVGPRA